MPIPALVRSFALGALLYISSTSSADLPELTPSFTMPLPGFPGADGHDAVAICESDIIVVRHSDRSVRVLRETSVGSWSDEPLPGQGAPQGSSYTRVYGAGSYLSVVFTQGTNSRVEIFERDNNGTWSIVQTISSPLGSAFVNLNHAVWSGSTLLVADRYADSYRGAAFIFERNQKGRWIQTAKLQGSGATPTYTEVWSVGLDGDRAVLGHWLNSCGYSAVSGRAYVFERGDSGTWSEVLNFRPNSATCGDAFAANVSLAGDFMYASAPNADRIYRVKRSAEGWNQVSDVVVPTLSSQNGARLLATDWGLIAMTYDARLVLSRHEGSDTVPFAVLNPSLVPTVGCYCWNIAYFDNRVVTITGSPSGSELAIFEIGSLFDCDSDGISNQDEVLAGARDVDGNGIPDECQCNADPLLPFCCVADVIANGVVDGADLSAVLAVWGTDGGLYPRADTNGDGVVDGQDLATVLGGWGPCGG